MPSNQPPEPRPISAPLVSLIIPTRNERENVWELLDILREVLADVSTEIVIVDDSDDRTQEEAERAAAALGLDVRVIHREGKQRKGGLSTAVLMGIQVSNGEYFCVMDADLQHPPRLAWDMLRVAQEKNADIVAASRYAKGGSDGGLSSNVRKILSRASKWLVTLLFFPRLIHVTDPLTGYFVARRSIVEGVNLSPSGFKILLEVLIRTRWQRSVDVPLRFERRHAGQSKATIRQGAAFLRHVLTLFWETRVRRLAPRRRR